MLIWNLPAYWDFPIYYNDYKATDLQLHFCVPHRFATFTELLAIPQELNMNISVCKILSGCLTPVR